jgi:hypothetical protein
MVRHDMPAGSLRLSLAGDFAPLGSYLAGDGAAAVAAHSRAELSLAAGDDVSLARRVCGRAARRRRGS